MGSYVWPCPSYSRVSSPFGNRIHPITQKTAMHYGVDLAAASGAAILATRPGTVKTAKYSNSYGNYIELDHGGGVTSRYAHASKLLVSAGAAVSAGQKIALVGTTGSSTGCHLHFEIRVNGTAKNPLNYVSAKDTVNNYTGQAASASEGDNTSDNKTKKEKKEITTVIIRSATGTSTSQKEQLTGLPPYLQNGVEILIQHDGVYLPAIEGDVVLDRSRKGGPSKLTFTVLKDETLNFQEGNPVSFRFNGNPVFFGYVFSKSRSDAVKIKVTCYDQIRYLKNKDTLSYTNKTYAELLRMIAADYSLKCGTVEDTKYKIASRIEEGALLDMLGNASDLTVMNTGNLYVLYDDFGKLTLQNIQTMKLDIVVDSDTAQGYDYVSSIDSDTYNRIKLAVDNGDTGQREVHVLNEGTTQASWGVLQYYEKLDEETPLAVLKAKAETLLKYYNKKSRSLKISKVFGDIRVRGGSSVVVMMGLGDINVKNYMVVEEVRHTFTHGLHAMDLTLVGIKGEFMA